MDTDDSFIRKGSHLEQRQKLGLSDHPRRSNARQFQSEPTSGLEKVEVYIVSVNIKVFAKNHVSGSDLISTSLYFLIIWLFCSGGEGKTGRCPI